MHCPRCGTPNEPGDRYCGSCGAQLPRAEKPKEQIPPRERLRRLVGTTPKARWITLATLVAIVVAIVAFVALKPSEDSIPRDAYTLRAEHICLASKRNIAAIESQFAREGKGTPSSVARELVPVIAAWRSEMAELKVPADRTGPAEALEGALLEAEVQIGGLARAADAGDKRRLAVKAREAETASAGVEEAVQNLGLSDCAEAVIGFASNSG